MAGASENLSELMVEPMCLSNDESEENCYRRIFEII